MIINSSYSDNNYDNYDSCSLSIFDFDLLGVYGVKDVNSFYKKYKRKLYYSERTKFWNKWRQQILDKKFAGSSSRLRIDYNRVYQRD